MRFVGLPFIHIVLDFGRYAAGLSVHASHVSAFAAVDMQQQGEGGREGGDQSADVLGDGTRLSDLCSVLFDWPQYM